MAAPHKGSVAVPGAKLLERKGIIKEAPFRLSPLSQLFLFPGFGTRVPSRIALSLPDPIFPLGFLVLLIAGHKNQLGKGEELPFLGMLFFPGKREQPLWNLAAGFLPGGGESIYNFLPVFIPAPWIYLDSVEEGDVFWGWDLLRGEHDGLWLRGHEI